MTPPVDHAGHFDRLHREDPDPWDVEGGWYERRKRAVTLASLPEERYANAFEPGCSVGALSRDLARRCDRVLAVDLSPRAIELARTRAAAWDNVAFAVMRVPEQWPQGEVFDLVVLSEMGSYFTPGRWARLLDRTVASLRPGGTVVACHWRHPAPDHEQSAAQVHAACRSQPGLVATVAHTEPDFLLDVFLRRDHPTGTTPR